MYNRLFPQQYSDQQKGVQEQFNRKLDAGNNYNQQTNPINTYPMNNELLQERINNEMQ